MKITKRVVDATRAALRDTYLWDAELRGFGVKVTPSGTKVYFVQYRMGGRGTATKRYTIGKHGSPWTPELARGEAMRILHAVADGKDPQAEKMAARAPADRSMTVAGAFEAFMTRHVSQTRVRKEYLGAFANEVLPHWGNWPLETVAKRHVIAMLDRMVDRGVAVRANRVFAYVRKFFNWCVSRDLISSSPCAGVKPPTEERERDRVLSMGERRALWEASEDLGWPFGPFAMLLLLTAQRLNEVAGMRWSEIDLEASLWTLPAARAKNGQAHHVPLSNAAVTLLRELPRMQGSDFVFTTTGRSPISGFSRAKTRLDAGMAERLAAISGAESTGTAGIVPDWRFHDIRRTATTGMAALGIPPHVVDRILNHVQGSIRGVAAVYNRHAYLDERRKALDAWAEAITPSGTERHKSGA